MEAIADVRQIEPGLRQIQALDGGGVGRRGGDVVVRVEQEGGEREVDGGGEEGDLEGDEGEGVPGGCAGHWVACLVDG